MAANHAAARDVIYLPTQRKGLTGAAHIRNDRLDILAANLLGRALYPRMSAGPGARQREAWRPGDVPSFTTERGSPAGRLGTG